MDQYLCTERGPHRHTLNKSSFYRDEGSVGKEKTGAPAEHRTSLRDIHLSESRSEKPSFVDANRHNHLAKNNSKSPSRAWSKSDGASSDPASWGLANTLWPFFMWKNGGNGGKSSPPDVGSNSWGAKS